MGTLQVGTLVARCDGRPWDCWVELSLAPGGRCPPVKPVSILAVQSSVIVVGAERLTSIDVCIRADEPIAEAFDLEVSPGHVALGNLLEMAPPVLYTMHFDAMPGGGTAWGRATRVTADAPWRVGPVAAPSAL